MNNSHLDALNLRLSNERCYIAAAKTVAEKEIRNVWITQIMKEIEGEKAFLGISTVNDEISHDDLMKELLGE